MSLSPDLIRTSRLALVLLLSSSIVLACGDDSSDDEGVASDVTSTEVIHADYGGTTREAHIEAALEPFAEETGIRGIFR